MDAFIPYIGYAASAVILLSFVMKDMVKLRITNIIGCAIFVAYGLLIPENGMPIVITNVAIVGVNLFYLLKKN